MEENEKERDGGLKPRQCDKNIKDPHIETVRQDRGIKGTNRNQYRCKFIQVYEWDGGFQKR